MIGLVCLNSHPVELLDCSGSLNSKYRSSSSNLSCEKVGVKRRLSEADANDDHITKKNRSEHISSEGGGSSVDLSIPVDFISKLRFFVSSNSRYCAGL